MRIGIAFNLKPKNIPKNLPEDIFEEYDSEEVIFALKNVFEKFNFDVVFLESGKNFLKNVLREKVDFVFNIAEGFGTRSREGHVPSVCEILNIPYSFSDPLSLNITLDKEICKRFAKSINIRTPYFKVIKDFREIKNLKFKKFPAILKLKNEGSSIGLRLSSKVNNIEELREKCFYLLKTYKEPVLIEEFISGKEITVGVIGNYDNVRVLGMMEIRPKKLNQEDFIYSLEVKRNYKEEVDYIVPPEIKEKTKKEIEKFSLKIYKMLGLRDISRIDFRLDKDEKPYFLEVNPLPGLNPNTSDLPIMAYKFGINYEDLIREILKNAFSRYEKFKNIKL